MVVRAGEHHKRASSKSGPFSIKQFHYIESNFILWNQRANACKNSLFDGRLPMAGSPERSCGSRGILGNPVLKA